MRVIGLGLLAALAPSGLALTGPMPLRPAIVAAPTDMQVGDWVFRGGVSSDSRWIRMLSGGSFSHVGVVVQTVPSVLIAHATTDDDPVRPDQVILTAWEDFASADRADRLAVARPRFMSAAQREASAHHVAARAGQRFVLAGRDAAPLYCTTVLLDAVQAQAPHFKPEWQRLDVPVMRGEYLFPKALAQADLQWLMGTEPFGP
ncbi:hypothetical protein AAHN93_08215 [Vandammella animalimorsus]|nr:hypothetical protein [Vandammella animalimorsus]